MKVLIKIRNNDNESCRWFLVKYYNPVNPSKNRTDDRELAKQFSFNGAKFLVFKKDFAKI